MLFELVLFFYKSCPFCYSLVFSVSLVTVFSQLSASEAVCLYVPWWMVIAAPDHFISGFFWVSVSLHPRDWHWGQSADWQTSFGTRRYKEWTGQIRAELWEDRIVEYLWFRSQWNVHCYEQTLDRKWWRSHFVGIKQAFFTNTSFSVLNFSHTLALRCTEVHLYV